MNGAKLACLIITVLGLGCAIAAIAILVLVYGPRNGCVMWGYPQCETPRSFRIQVLFLAASDFPLPILKEREFPGLLRGSQEHMARSYYGKDEFHANHEIWRYATIQQATNQFDWLREGEFRIFLDGAIRESVDYVSPIANKFYADCQSLSARGYRRCAALGQYDEYVGFFDSQISPEFISEADFISLLEKIDQRMAQSLGKVGPVPTKTP